jgi:hypothetical protein
MQVARGGVGWGVFIEVGNLYRVCEFSKRAALVMHVN